MHVLVPATLALSALWPIMAQRHIPEEKSMDGPAFAETLKPKYKRVVLKLSGEGFGHRGKSGISIDETLRVARQAQRVLQSGVQLAIVVGAGNILRGAQFSAG